MFTLYCMQGKCGPTFWVLHPWAVILLPRKFQGAAGLEVRFCMCVGRLEHHPS